MSRPALAPEDRLSETIWIRVTPRQKALLEAAARKAGADTSTWLRTLALLQAAPRKVRRLMLSLRALNI